MKYENINGYNVKVPVLVGYDLYNSHGRSFDSRMASSSSLDTPISVVNASPYLRFISGNFMIAKSNYGSTLAVALLVLSRKHILAHFQKIVGSGDRMCVITSTGGGASWRCDGRIDLVAFNARYLPLVNALGYTDMNHASEQVQILLRQLKSLTIPEDVLAQDSDVCTLLDNIKLNTQEIKDLWFQSQSTNTSADVREKSHPYRKLYAIYCARVIQKVAKDKGYSMQMAEEMVVKGMGELEAVMGMLRLAMDVWFLDYALMGVEHHSDVRLGSVLNTMLGSPRTTAVDSIGMLPALPPRMNFVLDRGTTGDEDGQIWTVYPVPPPTLSYSSSSSVTSSSGIGSHQRVSTSDSTSSLSISSASSSEAEGEEEEESYVGGHFGSNVSLSSNKRVSPTQPKDIGAQSRPSSLIGVRTNKSKLNYDESDMEEESEEDVLKHLDHPYLQLKMRMLVNKGYSALDAQHLLSWSLQGYNGIAPFPLLIAIMKSYSKEWRFDRPLPHGGPILSCSW